VREAADALLFARDLDDGDMRSALSEPRPVWTTPGAAPTRVA
jgi:hypothetical protein